MLRAHDVVGAAIGLARDHRDLGHGRLGEGEEQLRAVLDDGAVFLRRAREKSRHVDESNNGDVEAVAEAHEARRLARAVDVEAAGQHHRLVGDDADGRALHAREADDDVAGEARLQLEEIALVDHLGDQLLHVVGLVGAGRDQRVERRLDAVGRVPGRPHRRLLAVGGGQEIDEAAQLQERLDIVLEREVGDARARRMRDRAAQLLLRDTLMRHRLHHVGAGDEHV